MDDVYGIDTVNLDGSPFDDNWHGTHNHGLVGATADNGLGVAGIAGITRRIRQLSCKFLNRDGSGTLAGALECIDYAVSKGATVLLFAFGAGNAGPGAFGVVGDVLDSLALSNIFVSAAAGNLGRNLDVNDWIPCSHKNKPNMVCSTAVDSDKGELMIWANYGQTTVDIAAVADFVKSTSVWGRWGRDDTLQNHYGGGKYDAYWDYGGSSMAAAQLAGVAALLLALDGRMTPVDMKTVLLSSVDIDVSLYDLTVAGGRVNAYKAIDYQAYFLGGLAQPTADWSGATISFADTNPLPGVVAGTMTLSNLPTDSTAVSLFIFFADATGEYVDPSVKFAQPTSSPANGGVVDVVLTTTIIPDTATSLKACPVSSSELVGDACVLLDLTGVDVGILSNAPRALSFFLTDEDTRFDKARVSLQFLACEDESGISTYRVYQIDGSGNKVGSTPLAEVKKVGYHSPVVSGPSKDAIVVTKKEVGEMWEIERAGYGNNEDAVINVWGPGTVKFEKLNLETNHDWIYFLGGFYSEPFVSVHRSLTRSLPIGQTSFTWHSDFNVTSAGDYGTAFPSTPNDPNPVSGWKMEIIPSGDLYRLDVVVDDLSLGNTLAVIPTHHGMVELDVSRDGKPCG